MPQNKEVHREYMRKRRGGSQDTVKGVTSPVILSDGQLWYPGNYGYHPKECQCKVHPDRTQMTDADYAEMITPRGLV